MTQSPNATPGRRTQAVVVSLLLAGALAAVAVSLITSIARPETSPPAADTTQQSTTTAASSTTSTTLLQTGPADLFVAPAAQGTGDGSSSANAAAIDDLDDLIAAAGPGGIIEVIQSGGDYSTPSPIFIRNGGEPGDPVTIRGPLTGIRPTFVGDRTDPYSPGGNPGKPLFRLEQGADHLRFANLHCAHVGNGCFLVNAPVVDLTIASVTAENVQRFFETGTAENGKNSTVSGLEISQVTVEGFSKGAIRLGHDTSDVVISDVAGDSLSQDGDNFAIGVHLVDTVHNVLLERVTMKNALDTLHPYWNGDGFAAEVHVYDITMIDTTASGNSDAGYDIKASNVEMSGVTAHDNKRNYRFSGQVIVLEDCVGTAPNRRGGTGTQVQVHASGGAEVEVIGCEFLDSDGETIVFDIDEQAVVSVSGGEVSFAESAMLSTVEPDALLEIADTVGGEQ